MNERLFEYRIVWQREGYAKKRRLFQTRRAAERFALVAQGRVAEATGLDPNDYACCGGYECGCGGKTNAETWAAESARIPALVFGPVIERREVGTWANGDDQKIDGSPRSA